jgi:hypothetical protein
MLALKAECALGVSTLESMKGNSGSTLGLSTEESMEGSSGSTQGRSTLESMIGARMRVGVCRSGACLGRSWLLSRGREENTKEFAPANL